MIPRRTLSKVMGGALLGSAALSLGLLGLTASEAAAAPTNAPSSTTGSFDCGGGLTGTFTVNAGNAQGTAWNVAHLTFDSGATAIFQPTANDNTITYMGQTFTNMAAKNNNSGTTTCAISASGNGFTLTGEVTGNIIYTG